MFYMDLLKIILLLYSFLSLIIILAVIFPIILWIILKVRRNWGNFKQTFTDFEERIQNLRFRNYVDFVHLVVLISLFIFKVNPFYVLLYLPLYITTRMLIGIVRNILQKSKKGISEYRFFVYLLMFSIVIISYIFSFSLLYFHTSPLKDGHFQNGEGNILILNRIDSLYYSGFTFFSMNYEDIQPKGLIKTITLSEVFGAQVVLMLFIGIMAAELISNIHLKEVKDE